MMEDDSKQIINDCIDSIKDRVKEELKNYNEEEIYIQDIISEEIDNYTPQNRQDCLNLIDTANEEHFDSGLIDMSSLDKILITMAYCSLEQAVYNDDGIQELQKLLNNEVLSVEDANELLKKIEDGSI